jgi:crotonobetainyl-CoA:carnitine CoA-transferase CaiB-like acyl-CoA transferase
VAGAAAIRPLDGVRVLDFTTAVAGPICGFVLADLGAEVIKVEEPNARLGTPGDMAPREGAPDRPYNRLSNFNELNRGKLSVPVDVAQPEGRELFLRIAAMCDIVVENFSPRVVGNLGVDYAAVRCRNPAVIYISMPAFGKTGPYADMRSYGPGIDAMSGLSHLTGYVNGQPLKPGSFYCDQNAGLHAAFAALSALFHRRRTGEGQYIEVPMLEGEIQVIADALIDVVMNGRERTRLGNRHPSIAPHGVYPCRGNDEWVTIVAADDRQWWALCRAMGREDLLGDPRFAEPLVRYHHQDALDAIIAAWTMTRRKEDVQRTLQAVGVSAAAVLEVPELFEDPHMAARGQFEWVEHPDSSPFPHTRVAFRLSETPAAVVRSGPLFGDGVERVLRGLLGIPDADLERLFDAGIIADDRSRLSLQAGG